MNFQKDRRKTILLIAGWYIGISLVEGAILSAQGFPALFVPTFVLNAACLAGIYWLHKNG
ncbi:hypothetical protein [Cryobacterium zhongshanensis]|uniref:Uncharacterized protein n=1 Tax=Cryobacterium zhongshanensis TaxID=2928153 RepID=A0AA41UGU8_9MICO|nr:hypothetical protein [Cryobacterium zhongshanensis]MCI4659572.1 hypothetical protein [Cryobacterium zhongshanensis]